MLACRLPKILLCVLAAAASLSCVTPAKIRGEIEELVRVGRYDDAVLLLEESRDVYADRDQLLYDLEYGMLLHVAGRYRASNEVFEHAKAVAEQAETISVTGESATWLVNDSAREYQGYLFERIMLHVFSALNYVQIGDGEATLVEARRIDHLIKRATTDEEEGTFREPAFARYLSGMLYEGMGQWNDAYIAYWKALEGYEDFAKSYGVKAPASLLSAGARVARHMGPQSEREYRERWGAGAALPFPSDSGEVVVLHYNGRAPIKIDQFIDMSFGKAWAYVNVIEAEDEEQAALADATALAASIPASETVRIAFPKYVEQPYEIERVQLSADGALAIGPAELVTDLGKIAMKNLDDHIARIRAKAIARAAIKYALAKGVSAGLQSSGDSNAQLVGVLLGAAVTVYNVLSERADKRTWSNVPDEIWMLKAEFPPGAHPLELSFLDERGRVIDSESRSVEVVAGERRFVIVRTVE